MVRQPTSTLFATALAVILSTGCGGIDKQHRSPLLALCQSISRLSVHESEKVRQAELALIRAEILLTKGDERCVDHYFQAASLAWYELTSPCGVSNIASPVAAEIYHGAIGGMIAQSQRFCRFDRRFGIKVHTASGESFVPIAYHGQRWHAGEFDRLIVVNHQRSKYLNHYYKSPGIGVPVIASAARSESDRFAPPVRLASATVLLRPDSNPETLGPHSMVIEIYDPFEQPTVDVGGQSLRLAADFSAPIAFALANSSTRETLQRFLQPGQTRPTESGLFMPERFRPGKIPVIFVHGLLSDRYTWGNAANEFRVRPDLRSCYQLWSYQYPTGEPFFQSAARLRRELEELRESVDPERRDAALDQIVIVGHSMGGLIAKLQVTSSGDHVWRSVASRPIDQITIDPIGRRNLTEALFFEPSPSVSRVVFIGTPHRGSAVAQLAIGRIGSLLVREPPELRERHRQLIAANPGVFSPELARRYPTSVDLLNPSSNMLQAISRLPIAPHVPYHSIIGTGCWMIGNGDSDGVVPVDSARLSGATTETMIHDRHTELPQDPVVIEEVFRILREHASEKAGFVDAVPIDLETAGLPIEPSPEPAGKPLAEPAFDDFAAPIPPRIGGRASVNDTKRFTMTDRAIGSGVELGRGG
jgi:pimeloyl-ACP methyl ester carboxylesterase